MKFSLKQLMFFVTVSAVLCAVLFALPGWLTVIVLMAMLLLMPTALIAVIVYGRGYSRAFSIGALWGGGIGPLLHIYLAYASMTTLVIVFELDHFFESSDELVPYLRTLFAVVVGLNVASGLISSGVYWLLRVRPLRRQGLPQTGSAALAPYSVFHGRLESVQVDTAGPQFDGSGDSLVRNRVETIIQPERPS